LAIAINFTAKSSRYAYGIFIALPFRILSLPEETVRFHAIVVSAVRRIRFCLPLLSVFLLTAIGLPFAYAGAPDVPQTTEELAAALDGNDSVLRGKALTALVLEKKDPRSLQFATRALKDANWYNRMNAARLLGGMKDPGAVEALAGALQDDKWNVREIAAEALGRIGGERGVETLLAALKSPFPDVKVRAANILTLVKFPGAVAVMKKALSDENPAVRLTAALAIQNTEPGETAPLASLLDDRDPALREKAALFLGRVRQAN
jgi:HEAT repeat protein